MAKQAVVRASRLARVLGPLAGRLISFAGRNPGMVLAGGIIRDALMGRTSKDIDVAVESGAAMKMGKRFADSIGGALVVLGQERLARVHLGDSVVDFTPLRAKTLDDDLRLRDFTVNAMAVRAPWGESAEILDPTGGLKDLAGRTVRACGPRSFRDDPVRLWRAHRMAVQLGFRMAPETARLVRTQAALAKRCTPERLRDELFRLLALPDGARALKAALGSGVLTATFPELKPMLKVAAPGVRPLDVMDHTLEALEHLERILARPAAVIPREAAEATRHLKGEPVKGRPRASLLKLAALLHDIAKPATVKAGGKGEVHFYGHETQGAEMAGDLMRRRLRLSEDEVGSVSRVIRNHLRLGHLAVAGEFSDRAVYRLLQSTGEEFLETVLHAEADRLATHHDRSIPAPRVRRTVSRVLAFRRAMLARKPLKRFVTGHDLMAEFGLKPGPQVGVMLKAVDEAVALGRVRDRTGALKVAGATLDRNPR